MVVRIYRPSARPLLLLVVSVFSFVQGKKAKGSTDSGNVEQTIKDLENQAKDATLKGDRSFNEKYLADNCLRVYGNGSIEDQAQASDLFKSGKLKITSMTIPTSR